MRFLLILIMLIPCLIHAVDMNTQGLTEHTVQLMTFVEKAAEFVRTEDENAFPKLRSPEWQQGDQYIFVWSMDGTRLVYPPDPKAEGQNMNTLKDSDGRLIGLTMIAKAASKDGCGWAFYRWPKMGGKEPEWKATYVKRVKTVKDREVLVGSGVYDFTWEPAFIPELAGEVELLFQRDGLAAINRLKENPQILSVPNGFAFILDAKANWWVHPGNPKLVDKPFLETADPEAKEIWQKTLNGAMAKSVAISEYLAPGSDGVKSAHSLYLMRVMVENTPLFIGVEVKVPIKQ